MGWVNGIHLGDCRRLGYLVLNRDVGRYRQELMADQNFKHRKRNTVDELRGEAVGDEKT